MINLSKAYAGQIVGLRSGDTFTIEFCEIKDGNEVLMQFCSDGAMTYALDGTYIGVKNLPKWDIVSLSDPIQVQAARIEGEIKGLQDSMNCKVYLDDSDILAAIYRLNEQLKALRNESN